MKLTKKELIEFKNKIITECPKLMTRVQWSVFNTLVNREKETFDEMAKSLKMHTVHFDSALMVSSSKIRKFLKKEGLTENQSRKVIRFMIDNK